jgi:predicted TIM-barrel fold metal-dependent hydrolase
MDAGMSEAQEVVDCWLNAPVGKPDPTAQYLFPGLVERWEKEISPSQLVDEMDEAGISKAVLVSGWGEEDSVPWVKNALKSYPHRFAASHIIDPREGLSALRRITDLVRNEGYRLIRMLAFVTQKSYGDPIYYPAYAKCAELGVPVGVNVGIPGPRVPSQSQHPLPLDEVCYFFPELTVIMSHGGEPWEELCVKLMLKWPNLFYMTSAFAPKYIPKAIMHYLNTRGSDRILWASDHPVIPFQRCMAEIKKLEFRDEATRTKFLSGNANRLIFDRRPTDGLGS